MKEEKKTEGMCLSGSLTDGSMIGMVVVSRDGRPFVERAAYHHPKTRGEITETLQSLTAELDGPTEGRFMFSGSTGEVMLVRAAELGSDPGAALEKLVRKRWSDWEERVIGIYAADLSKAPGRGQDLLLYAVPRSELEGVVGPVAGLGMRDIQVAPASLLVARALAAEKTMADERVAILDLAAERTQIVIAHKGAVVAERGVDAGLDSLFAAIQHKLELKFIGSAAKLFYDGIYDFSDVEDELLAELAEKILPGVKELETAMGKPVGRVLPLNLAAETIWVERPLAKFFDRPLPVFSAESLAKVSGDLGRLGEVVCMQALLAALARGSEAWSGLTLATDGAPGLKPGLAALLAAPAAPAPAETEKGGKAKVAATPPPRPSTANPAPEKAPTAGKTAAPVSAAKATDSEPGKAATPPAKAPAPKPAAPVAKAPVVAPKAPAEGKPEKKKSFALIGGAAAAVIVAIGLGFLFMGGGESESVRTASTGRTMPEFARQSEEPSAAREEPAVAAIVEPAASTPSAGGVSAERAVIASTAPRAAETGTAASPVERPAEAAETASLDSSAELAAEGPVEAIEAEVEEEEVIEPEPTTGALMVVSPSEGASVYLDGELVGMTPLELADLEEGDYVIRLELPGFDPAEHLMTVIAGETATAELPALREEAATLRIVSSPEGIPFEVRFEDQNREPLTGSTPATMAGLPLGAYEIVYSREGWGELRTGVALERSRDEVESVLEFPAGTLVITSEPMGADVFRDGERIGVTPLRLEEIPPGSVEISAVMANFAQGTQTAVVEAGNETELSFDLVDYDRIFIVSQVHTQPKPVTQTPPGRMPRVLNVENIVVRCVIDQLGEPTDIEILSSSNTRLNNVVMETVAQWRFEPATYLDRPVKTLVTIPFVFRPEDR